jgi:hypothetical protein
MNFVEAIDVRIEEIGSACTRRGKYFKACPLTQPAEDAEPTKVLFGIVDILRSNAGSVEAEAWTSAHSSSGFCIEACDYGVIPRTMIRLAHLAMTRRQDGEAVKSNAMRSFRDMAKAVRIVSRLQPETDALNELQPRAGQERPEIRLDIGRYQLQPVVGAKYIADDAEPDYLITEIRQRTEKEPVKFRLLLQLAGSGNKLDDPSIAWPDNRETADLGMLTPTRIVADEAAYESLLFLPNALPEGIETADPMIDARGQVYPVSFGRRQ